MKPQHFMPFWILPLLSGIASVLPLVERNFHQLATRDIFFGVGSVCLLCGAVCLCCALLFKNNKAAIVLASFSVFIFFSYGRIYSAIDGQQFLGVELGRHRFLLLLLAAIFFLGSYFLIRFASFSERVARLGLTFLLIMIAFSFLRMLPNFFYSQGTLKFDPALTIEKDFKNLKAKETPDIYFMVFDRYASNRTLKKYYQFDNSDFLDELRQRGFFVNDAGFSNYPKTEFSLASMLNATHLGFLTQKYGRDYPLATPLYKMIDEFYMANFLKNQGYRFVHFGSWWGATIQSAIADENVNTQMMSEFLRYVYKESMMGVLGNKLGWFDENREQWRRVQFQFARLKKIESEQPLFVFAHMLIPHPPYVFTEAGEFVSAQPVARRDIEVRYVSQMRYLNAQILGWLDELAAKPAPNGRIVILQADEGPFPDRYAESDNGFDWSSVTMDEIQEKMGTLSAYWFSDPPPPEQVADLKPVNLFRFIAKHYLGLSTVPMLPDQYYLPRDENRRPFDLIDVTDKIQALQREGEIDVKN